MIERRIFVDANVFIQMKDLRDLDWTELFPGIGRLEVIVSKTVVDELDKLKTDRIDRRRKRARLALKAIEQASGGSEHAGVVRKEPYQVRLTVAFPHRRNWGDYPLLDPNHPDDRLVLHVLEESGAALLSDDTGPRIAARKLGIEVLDVPDAFRLPDEETEDARTIRNLKAEIARAEAEKPRIEFRANRGKQPIVLRRAILPPMPDALVERAVAHVLSLHPEARPRPDGIDGIIRLGRHVTDADVRQYHARYATFAGRVRDFFRNLNVSLNAGGAAVPLGFEIRNAGRQVLENVRVRLAVEGDARLVVRGAGTPDDDEEDTDPFALRLPRPPDPDTLWESRATVGLARALAVRLPRLSFPGRTDFEWTELPDDEDGDGSGTLGCSEVEVGHRHVGEVGLRCAGEEVVEAVLNVDIRARNLERERLTLTVRVEPFPTTWTVASFAPLGKRFEGFGA